MAVWTFFVKKIVCFQTKLFAKLVLYQFFMKELTDATVPIVGSFVAISIVPSYTNNSNELCFSKTTIPA